MLTREEHLLVVLAEECTEVAKNSAKALRFGLDDRNVLDPSGPTNRERLVSELVDLWATIELLIENGSIAQGWLDSYGVEAKKAKVREFMRYAEIVGRLVADGETEGRDG